VVWVDVTSHSNNKGFHFLTFSLCLSIDKQLVWMWIFIPNQQRFSFRWVFKEALPKLVPKWLRERVLFFMKNGDPQQFNEILLARKSVFVNVSEGTCGFHVVHMGWRTNVPTCVNILSPQKLGCGCPLYSRFINGYTRGRHRAMWKMRRNMNYQSFCWRNLYVCKLCRMWLVNIGS
jgi:hypothetical protein